MTAARLLANARSWVGYYDPAGAKVWAAVDYPQWTGQAWCAAFTHMILAGDGRQAQLAAPLPFFCPSLECHATQRGTWTPVDMTITADMAEPGDVVIFDWEADGIDDHVGIVVSVGDGAVRTIEGNTAQNDWGDQSNGGWVAERTRYPSQVRGFISIDYSLNGPASVDLGVQPPAENPSLPTIDEREDDDMFTDKDREDLQETRKAAAWLQERLAQNHREDYQMQAAILAAVSIDNVDEAELAEALAKRGVTFGSDPKALAADVVAALAQLFGKTPAGPR
jgi:hypothetical protein